MRKIKSKITSSDFFFQAEIRNEQFLIKDNFHLDNFQNEIRNNALPTVGEMKNKTSEEIEQLIKNL